ncbi:MAG: hypothetical protein ACOYWZ_04490 [Bacillota bacterium]
MTKEDIDYFKDAFLLGIMKHRRKKVIFEPLKITFSLSSPLCLNFPWLYFDGLISHLMLRSALGNDYYLLPSKDALPAMNKALRGFEFPKFPIKQTKGMYHSSASILDVDKKLTEIMFKRFEERWAGDKKKKIYRGIGFFRDYAIRHIYIPAKTVVFYVCGDREILNDLCKLVGGLGDNTRIGWGAVRDFRIEEIEEDWSIIKDGVAMRAIPKNLLQETEEKVYIAWKPPYWASESIAMCAPPGAKVLLKK